MKQLEGNAIILIYKEYYLKLYQFREPFPYPNEGKEKL